MHPVVTIDPIPLPTVAPTTSASALPPLDSRIDVEQEKKRLIAVRDQIMGNSNDIEHYIAHDNRIIFDSVQEILDSIDENTTVSVFLDKHRLILDFLSLSNDTMQHSLSTKKKLVELLDRKREQLRLLKP